MFQTALLEISTRPAGCPFSRRPCRIVALAPRHAPKTALRARADDHERARSLHGSGRTTQTDGCGHSHQLVQWIPPVLSSQS